MALALTERLELRGQDWTTTRAFAQPADNQGYVRVNLRGRERDGIVEPGEAEALMDEIASGLMTFTDADGAPAVKAVERVADTFDTGVHSDRLPDLIVRWSDRPATRLTEVVSPRFGTVKRRGHGSGRSGNHTAGDAWALVVPGASTPVTPSRPPRLVDIAATAAALAGRDARGPAGRAPSAAVAGGAGCSESGFRCTRTHPTPLSYDRAGGPGWERPHDQPR